MIYPRWDPNLKHKTHEYFTGFKSQYYIIFIQHYDAY